MSLFLRRVISPERNRAVCRITILLIALVLATSMLLQPEGASASTPSITCYTQNNWQGAWDTWYYQGNTGPHYAQMQVSKQADGRFLDTYTHANGGGFMTGISTTLQPSGQRWTGYWYEGGVSGRFRLDLDHCYFEGFWSYNHDEPGGPNSGFWYGQKR